MFAILLALFATSTPAQIIPSAIPEVLDPYKITLIQEAQASELKPVATTTTPEHIVEVFGDERMVAVLNCESGLRQFSTSTIPLISPTHDVGVAQINQIHWKDAEERGLDIHNSLEDNLKMAKVIYDEEGINAWVCHRLVNDG